MENPTQPDDIDINTLPFYFWFCRNPQCDKGETVGVTMSTIPFCNGCGGTQADALRDGVTGLPIEAGSPRGMEIASQMGF